MQNTTRQRTEKSKLTPQELRKSLNLLIIAVTFGISFFVVTSGAPLTGFTRELGANDLVYGIIMALPVLGGIIQIFTSYFLENTGKRKMIFMLSSFVQRPIWLVISLIALLFPPSHTTIRLWAITVLITVSSAAGSIGSVAFFSWIGAIVPMDIRGRFFSKRTMIYTITGAIVGLAAGKLLDVIGGLQGFAIVFALVAILGTLDIVCFFGIKDPPMELPQERIPFKILFKQPYKNRNYMRYVIFIAVWNFGMNLPGPFFAVYMLEYLKMPFFTISLFSQFTSNIATIAFIRVWGKLIDRFGNRPVMTICGALVIGLPVLWLLAAPQNYYIIIVINILAGAFWPGFDMAAMNLSIWLAPEKNRSIYVATYALITSVIGVALAYICGGAFMQVTRPLITDLDLPFVMGQRFNAFHLLYAISTLIRLAAILFFLPKVKEENSRDARSVLMDISKRLKTKFRG